MGRRRPVFRPHFFLRDYLRPGAISAPSACDYSAAAATSLGDIYLNQQLGDCVIAAGYHMLGVETGNAGDLFIANDAQIIADYSAIGGYNPNNPSSDQGCDEVTALNYWCNKGFADGSKLYGWLAADASSKLEIQSAIYLFENLIITMELPDQWITPTTPTASGFTWDVDGPSDQNNGHCVTGIGYNPSGVKIATWGLLGVLTYEAIAQYCTQANSGGLYVVLTPDQLARGQAKAPNGVDWATLIQDFNAMAGSVPVCTATTPKPAKPHPAAPHSTALPGAPRLEWPTFSAPEIDVQLLNREQRSPALGVLAVVGLLVTGVVGIIGLTSGSEPG
jgi:hypothetical protein